MTKMWILKYKIVQAINIRIKIEIEFDYRFLIIDYNPTCVAKMIGTGRNIRGVRTNMMALHNCHSMTGYMTGKS